MIIDCSHHLFLVAGFNTPFEPSKKISFDFSPINFYDCHFVLLEISLLAS